MFTIAWKFRQQLANLEVSYHWLYFGKNYTIISLEYGYKIALKHGVNKNEETKQKEILSSELDFQEFFVEGLKASEV